MCIYFSHIVYWRTIDLGFFFSQQKHAGEWIGCRNKQKRRPLWGSHPPPFFSSEQTLPYVVFVSTFSSRVNNRSIFLLIMQDSECNPDAIDQIIVMVVYVGTTELRLYAI